MTEWIDVLVYAAFLLIIWFLIPIASTRYTRPILEDRNPEWASANPDVLDRLTRRRWYLWGSYVLGALSIAVLLATQTDIWPQALSAPAFESEHWMVLSDVHTALVMIWLAYAVAGGALFTRWLTTQVPLAERRRASLEPRSIDTFVTRALRIAVYTAVGLHLAAWVFVGALRMHVTPAPSFWGMLAFQFLIAAIFLAIVRTIVLRRPHTMDRIFGPGFRAAEVRYAFVAQLLPLLNGSARLREAITGTASLDMDRAARLGLVLLMIASVLIAFGRFTRPSRSQSDHGPSRVPSSTRASTLLLLVLVAAALAPADGLSAQASTWSWEISHTDVRRIGRRVRGDAPTQSHGMRRIEAFASAELPCGAVPRWCH